jgi:hypothetical protein
MFGVYVMTPMVPKATDHAWFTLYSVRSDHSAVSSLEFLISYWWNPKETISQLMYMDTNCVPRIKVFQYHCLCFNIVDIEISFAEWSLRLHIVTVSQHATSKPPEILSVLSLPLYIITHRVLLGHPIIQLRFNVSNITKGVITPTLDCPEITRTYGILRFSYYSNNCQHRAWTWHPSVWVIIPVTNLVGTIMYESAEWSLRPGLNATTYDTETRSAPDQVSNCIFRSHNIPRYLYSNVNIFAPRHPVHML